jgi:uncharacterized protein (DUF1800 family)
MSSFIGRSGFTWFIIRDHQGIAAMSAPNPLLVALNRFGLGGRGAASVYLASAAADPRAFVRAELDKYVPALAEDSSLGASVTILKNLFDYQEQVRMARLASAAPTAPTSDVNPQTATAPPPPPPDGKFVQATFRAEAAARIRASALAGVGLNERLVAFWSNHFAISANKSPFVRSTAGAFEREAIRPHVLGRFGDMVRAVEQHPTMLHYLDNQQSMGPNSRGGLNQKKGLNENLAREIMELHTLGVGSGYTQSDVTNLARVITGWTYAGRDGRIGQPGSSVFFANWHEPGAFPLLGKTYGEDGRAQGEAALADLARHPATAKHIATKLARHFIADDPPPALVSRLTDTFLKTGGDLKAVTLALVNADEAWVAPLTKVRDPWQFMLASLRMFGRVPEEPNPVLGALNQLGEPLWTPPGPNGFPDTADAWASAEGMKLRLDISQQFARQLRDPPNPRDLIEDALGAAASDATKQAVARAETKQQGIALLLMSPEMQRR